MSLEQALNDNTAVMKQLIVVLSTTAESGALSAPREAPKSTRGKKTDSTAAAPAQSAQDAAAADASEGYLAEGDPVGTRYFHIPKHNTVYKQLPGEPDCTLAGALIVSGAEYLKQKAELAKKFPTAAAAPAPAAPASTPAPATFAPTAQAPAADASAAAGPSFEDVVNKMRELHKAQQNVGVKRVLDQFGAVSVPQLNGKAPNADLIGAIDSALMGL